MQIATVRGQRITDVNHWFIMTMRLGEVCGGGYDILAHSPSFQNKIDPKDELAAEMERASQALDFERAAVYRDRLSALSAIKAHQGVNPRGVEEADVFAIHQQGGFACVEVFFFRTGQNWGNRAYFPKADRSLGPGEILAAFVAQFYDDKPCPRLVLISHDIEDRELLAEALGTKSGHKIEVSVPR